MEARRKGNWLAAFCAALCLLTTFAAGAWAESPDYGNSTSTATAVNVNSSIAGVIGYGGDWDYFRISVPSSGTLTVYTTGSTDTYGYLKNSSGTDLASNDDYNGSVNFRISKTVTAGTYYIAVRNYYSTGTGSYTLVNQFSSGSTGTDDHGNSISTATAVNLNTSTAGVINSAGDYDYFRISVPSSGTLTVYTTGSTDTYGYLKNSSGTDLASNDDSGSLNFRISQSVSAGTYYVAVRHYSSTGTGAYAVYATFAATAQPAPTLILPSNGAINVPTTSDVTFSWNASLGATNYRIVISQNSSFSGFNETSMTCDGTCSTDTTSGTQKTRSLTIPTTTYYWRVRANGASGVSSWSATRSFTMSQFSVVSPGECSVSRGSLDTSTGDQRYTISSSCYRDYGWFTPVPLYNGTLTTNTNYDYRSRYYVINHGITHGGVDLVSSYSAPVPFDDNTPVYAIGDGIVRSIVRMNFLPPTRNLSVLYVEHASSNGNRFLAIYGHVYALDTLYDSYTLNGSVRVLKGQQLGTMRLSDNPMHLHFELNTTLTTNSFGGIKTGTVDPMQYLINNRGL